MPDRLDRGTRRLVAESTVPLRVLSNTSRSDACSVFGGTHPSSQQRRHAPSSEPGFGRVWAATGIKPRKQKLWIRSHVGWSLYSIHASRIGANTSNGPTADRDSGQNARGPRDRCGFAIESGRPLHSPAIDGLGRNAPASVGVHHRTRGNETVAANTVVSRNMVMVRFGVAG